MRMGAVLVVQPKPRLKHSDSGRIMLYNLTNSQCALSCSFSWALPPPAAAPPLLHTRSRSCCPGPTQTRRRCRGHAAHGTPPAAPAAAPHAAGRALHLGTGGMRQAGVGKCQCCGSLSITTRARRLSSLHTAVGRIHPPAAPTPAHKACSPQGRWCVSKQATAHLCSLPASACHSRPARPPAGRRQQ